MRNIYNYTLKNCECISGSVYNQIHNECPPKQLKDLEMSCPKDASGYFPNCVCNQGKVYDHKVLFAHYFCVDSVYFFYSNDVIIAQKSCLHGKILRYL